jgi:uncharacterized protein (DUF58 family)
MRHVHWGLTARHGQVMVREFEEERTRRLAVLVDTERDAGQAWTPLDRCCAVAASILQAAQAAGHGVRPIAAVGGGAEVLHRADGPEVLRWLARLEPSGVALADVVRGLAPADLRGVDTLVVVMPTWRRADAETLAAALADVPARRIVAVLVGLGEDEAPDADPGSLAEVLQRAGVETRIWRRDEDLAEVLGAAR